MEAFKDIKGYEGIYQVSELGKIKSLKRFRVPKDKILKPSFNSSGYYTLSLNKKGKSNSHTVHRLVYVAFNGKVGEGIHIHHKDQNKSNNTLENLEAMDGRKHISFHSEPRSNNVGLMNIIVTEKGFRFLYSYEGKSYSRRLPKMKLSKLKKERQRLINQIRNGSWKERKASSQYKGVSHNSKCNNWKANIQIGVKQIYLGRFKDELEAAIIYAAANELRNETNSLELIDNLKRGKSISIQEQKKIANHYSLTNLDFIRDRIAISNGYQYRII